MIETSATVLTDARFGLKRVFNTIRATTPQTIPTTVPASATAMFQSLYRFFGIGSGGAIDPNGYGLKLRPDEASLDTLDPFTTDPAGLHYKPVALVNRFDLAAANGSTCGESRIVFWKDRGPVTGRASIIVEMATSPVIKADGTRTCLPIAQFWQSLSAQPDVATRATMLGAFYFKGLPGMAFPPVSAIGVGFGGGAGQVRLNSFVNFAQWNLRELKWLRTCGANNTNCKTGFHEVTTKNNPSQLLFSGAHPNAATFQSWFVGTATPRLARATDVNALALGNANRFNTFESISQPLGDPTSVDYDAFASPALRSQVQAKLTALGSPLTPAQIFHRAETQTCGGCHQLSIGADLGGGLAFPPSLIFVQIDETATLSPALIQSFIPHRKDVLNAFLGCGGSGPQPTAADELTIDGRPLDSAN